MPARGSVCIHGTYKRLLEPILASGLKRMNSLHNHFACSLPQDEGVVILNAKSYGFCLLYFTMANGMKFYGSENQNFGLIESQ
ncbi:tRNA 2'-phosphotransferase 1 [Bienertia sinuspersici]